ncbi:cyclin-like protein [Coniella lustricola]|uniref:Cyclin-like protein n=1 Tax=Coniella lustricola TaxID=2025994 RepID=A0A2T3AF50_9PEZI|nr:cyclin-like protein [Coniella lustricola]
MDAKPQRPPRTLAVPPLRNENVPLNSTVPKAKTFDPQLALPQITVTGGFKAAARRTAFGDLSSNTRAFQHQQSMCSKGVVKTAALPVATATSKMAIYKENMVEDSKPKDTLLRPTQQPRHINDKIPRATRSLMAMPADIHFQHLVKQNEPKKTVMVYNDEQQPKSQALRSRGGSQPLLDLIDTAVPDSTRQKNKHDMQPNPNCVVNVVSAINESLDSESAVESGHDEKIVHHEPKPLGAVDLHKILDEQVAGDDYLDSLPGKVMPESEDNWDEDDDGHTYEEEHGYTTQSYKSYSDNTMSATTLIAPKKTLKVQKELQAAKMFVDTHRLPEDVEEEEWDVTMVAEYGEEIFEYMRELEERMRPNPHYMDEMQIEIKWSMRSILMDWLVQVHNRFALLPETLFLTVNYVDRFLSTKMVSLGKLQLVGATAIFVAAKYEEINCPSVQEIVFMVDGGFNADEILKAERFMLSILQFELGWPGPMSFLRRISKADDYDLETRTLAKYFLEVTIMDERFVGCVPSYLAAGAHCLARLMHRKGDWSLAHMHYSGYTWSQLRPLVAMILECCQSPKQHHLGVFEKYSDRRFKRSSIFVQEELAQGFALSLYNVIPRLSLCSATNEHSAPIRYRNSDSSGLLVPTEG